MRFSLIILLVASAVRATDFYIYDIEYNHRYLLDIDRFPSNKIPIGTYYFRIPVENLEETNIKIQVKQEDITDFKVNICGFYQHPNDSEILNGTDSTELEISSKFIDSKYSNYKFNVPTLKKEEKIKYLVVTILNKEALDYLSVYVYSSKYDKVPDQFKAYSIKYMKEAVLNKTILSKHKGVFIFILENEEIEKNKLIRLKFKKEYSPEIRFEFYGYEERPTTTEKLFNPVSDGRLSLNSLKRDEDYTIYEYVLEYSDKSNQKYLAFNAIMTESFDFISFYIGPES